MDGHSIKGWKPKGLWEGVYKSSISPSPRIGLGVMTLGQRGVGSMAQARGPTARNLRPWARAKETLREKELWDPWVPRARVRECVSGVANPGTSIGNAPKGFQKEDLRGRRPKDGEKGGSREPKPRGGSRERV